MSTVYIPPGRLSALPPVLKPNLHGSLLIVLNDLRRVTDRQKYQKAEKISFTSEDMKTVWREGQR